MANSIALFKNYIDQLDEVYKTASKTAVLDSMDEAKLNGAGYFEVPKMSLDGLGNYSRGSGYADGDVTLTIEEKRPDFDRGRSFSIDAMDNEETAGVAFGRLSAEFIRTKAVPEIDAYRFAKYAGSAKNKADAGAALSTGDDVINAIKKGVTAMEEDEVDPSGIYLFITPTLYNEILALDSYKSKAVLDSFAGVITVPQTRFYTAISQKDGKSSGETTGGYAKDSTGKDINFMLIAKSAVIQLSKHTVSKIIRPEENQNADAWKFCYRAYGLADAYDNKTSGIYLSKSTS